MSDNLVQVQPAVNALARKGVGANFFASLLKPGNILLVQPTSKEGTPGNLRIKETGQEFKEMQVVLMFTPAERRSLFEGEGFSAENLVCYSLDGIEPAKNARVPQAFNCAGCEKGSWDKYRQSGKKQDIPPCKAYQHLFVVDRVTKLPYFLDVRSSSLSAKLPNGYWNGMQNIARQMALLESEGRDANVFDFSFKVYGVKEGIYYTLGFKDFAPISDADRDQFGAIYMNLVKGKERFQAAAAEAEAGKEVTVAEAEIVEEPSSEVLEGDIVI
jgi:hypothetical protein